MVTTLPRECREDGRRTSASGWGIVPLSPLHVIDTFDLLLGNERGPGPSGRTAIEAGAPGGNHPPKHTLRAAEVAEHNAGAVRAMGGQCGVRLPEPAIHLGAQRGAHEATNWGGKSSRGREGATRSQRARRVSTGRWVRVMGAAASAASLALLTSLPCIADSYSGQPVPGVGELFGVACSTSSCEAVGDGTAVSISSGTPGTAQDIPNTNQLFAVVCSGASCEAAGDGLGEGVAVAITGGTPGPAEAVPGTQMLSGVSYPGAGCLAVGEDASGDGVVVPLADDTPPVPESVPGTESLGSVACTTDSACVAVGYEDGVGVVVPIISGIPGTAEAVPGTDSFSPNPPMR